MNKYLNLINPTAEDIKVIGRIVSVANDGVVASAYQIWDEYLHMWLGEINKKLYEYAMKHEGEIGGINDELQSIYDQLEKIKLGGIIDIKVNGENMRNGSELVVDLGDVVRDLSNYYLKDELYNKEEVLDLVHRLPKMSIIKLDFLPDDASWYTENIVLVPADPTGTKDYYDEYIVDVVETEMPDGNIRLNYNWEKIGSTKVDLSNYATKEDWPGTEYELFEATQEIWNTWLDSKNTPRSWVCLDNNGKIPASLLPNLNDEYTLTKNGTSIELKKNGSTVSSVADSDTTYSIMTSAQISAGTSTTGHVISAKVLKDEFDKKVDAEEGKGLSTNDYTNAEKEAVQQAVEQASNVNVELEGSVVTVTNKEGVEKEIDLLNATNERVYINVTTNKEDQSVAGLVINCFLNNDVDEPLQATTNANGQCYFDVPNNYHYRLVFPTIAGCDPITDVTHIAHASQRIVDVEYKETIEPVDKGEVLRVIARKRDEGEYSPASNVTMIIIVDGVSHTIPTDNDGVATCTIPYGKTYTVSIPDIDAHYIRGGVQQYSFTAEMSNRAVSVVYVSYDGGLKIIDLSGNEYDFELWKYLVEEETDPNLKKTNEEADVIKVITQTLAANNGVFGIDIDMITDGAVFQNLEWEPVPNNLISSIPASGNNVSQPYYYNGAAATQLIINEGKNRPVPLTLPAYTHVETITKTLGDTTYNGFYGSVGQWDIVRILREDIDDILQYVRPNAARYMSSLFPQSSPPAKMTCTQNGTSLFYSYTIAPSNTEKRSKVSCIPFLAM